MKKSIILILLIGITTNSFAKDMCADPAVKDNATKALGYLKELASKAHLNYKTAEVTTCNSYALVKLAYPSSNLCSNLVKENCIEMISDCGVLFTVANQGDMQNFAMSMKYNLQSLMGVCIQIDPQN